MKINMYTESYLRFETEYYKYVRIDKPLTMTIPDIERMMEQLNIYHFVVSARHTLDGRDHYFYFKKSEHFLYKDDDLIEFDYVL